VEEILSRLKSNIIEKKIEIKKSIDANHLFIDKLDLELIIYNLLHNAIKFSNIGGVVTIKWHNKILSIHDNGIGISADKIPFIFDRFYKSDDSRNTSGSGSGLGLSIVKEILVRYKVDIKVKSEVKKGTEFVITF
jgi:signal transduction histidine kinase